MQRQITPALYAAGAIYGSARLVENAPAVARAPGEWHTTSRDHLR
ncbi:MAG: hypothetical protein ACUVS2_04165 [Candidatus Flexifilum sp.]